MNNFCETLLKNEKFKSAVLNNIKIQPCTKGGMLQALRFGLYKEFNDNSLITMKSTFDDLYDIGIIQKVFVNGYPKYTIDFSEYSKPKIKITPSKDNIFDNLYKVTWLTKDHYDNSKDIEGSFAFQSYGIKDNKSAYRFANETLGLVSFKLFKYNTLTNKFEEVLI